MDSSTTHGAVGRRRRKTTKYRDYIMEP